ncbi:efflux RND transporter permease subunit [Pigmentibacter sp. JX0631]|uniref:efflux RND transporter permease subunit n=1 Tax=Pigmentibacter sp. JX0631 TaxID=2976982 RepID=UPI0024692A78|nr:efflux RND transporter permease subunit [Pigmentibacter sp. JX0631]WGL60440.1 efflux RND transporter permease subunit [Pigmentibacter sp. JX0631]
MINISDPFIKRPIATTLIMCAVFLVGILAYKLIPVAALPEVDYPTIQVKTLYPGASSIVVTSSITAPLEKQFGQMSGLKLMTSSSGDGLSLINLQFDLAMNLDIAVQEVQAAINTSSNLLPQDIPSPPIYYKVNPADTPIMTLSFTSDTYTLPEIHELIETRYVPKLSEIPGVGLVTINGGQKPAIRIQVNPTAIAGYNLNIDDIRNAILASNVNLAKGNIDGNRVSFTINANDQLLDINSYKNLIVSYRNNSPIYLKDLANIESSSENIRLAAWKNLTPALILNIQKQPTSNVIDVVNRIEKLLPILQVNIPKDIKIEILNDRTQSIRNSVSDAQFELFLAVILVVLIIYVFLNDLKTTLIPSVCVPLSLIGTFSVMYMLNFSLNNLTIMALTIATGFVVDDAIVMIENISRYVELGETKINAALKGSAQIGFTIISLTVSLIAVLIPLLFMGDIIGRLFREFSITLAVSILISAFISLTLTPMLCRFFINDNHIKKDNKLNKFLKSMIDKLIFNYSITLKIILNNQKTVLLISILTFFATIMQYYFIPKNFFPQQDISLIQGITESSESISFTNMLEKQKLIVNEILQDEAVLNVSSYIGVDGNNYSINNGRLLIRLKDNELRKEKINTIIERIQNSVQKIKDISLYMQAVQDINIDNRVSKTQYQFSLSSPSLTEVDKWTKILVSELTHSENLKDINHDLQNNGLQLKIEIDRNSAARFGITTNMIDTALYNAFGQRQISTIYTQSNQYHVILEVNPSLDINANNILNKIFILSNNKISIPLSAFTKVSYDTEPLVINKQEQFPVATISFNLISGHSLEQAVNDIEEAKLKINLPKSIETRFEGATQSFQNSLKNQIYLIIAAIIVVYIILGILYESYIHPITIISTLPSAGMGALFSLQLTKQNFDIISLIGIILLIGIVKKNAIMMIDFALELERKEKKKPIEAIYEACLLRFRPILMTTLAALLSAIPLAFGTGMGSELRRPLGISIIGGLIVSQLLTLYTTPVIYLFFSKLFSEKKKNIIQKESNLSFREDH